MIAGLLQNTNNNNVEKAPFLGDLPILGVLFRSTKFQRNETELVIIVTPYLVRPVSGQLAVPTDGYRAPDDLMRDVGGQTYTRRQRLPRTDCDSGTRTCRGAGVAPVTGAAATSGALPLPGSSCDPRPHQEGCDDALENRPHRAWLALPSGLQHAGHSRAGQSIRSTFRL